MESKATFLYGEGVAAVNKTFRCITCQKTINRETLPDKGMMCGQKCCVNAFFYFNKLNPILSFDTHNEIKPLKDLRVYSWCSGKNISNSRIIDISKNLVKRNIIFLPNILCKYCTTDSPFVYRNTIAT